MPIIKCKMCGGDLNMIEGQSVCECEYCGTRQTVPMVDDEKKMNLFARANRLRFNSEFDKASGIYESIIADAPEEAEAYWGLVLCKYGIEYVDDPTTGKKIPTCHRSSFDSVMQDSDFDLACEYADPTARKVYRQEAKQIEEIRKGILEVSVREEPYDIFICYKESDAEGNRTLDSVLAQDLYDALTNKGYRVFFARITLEDKLGQEYEPYIFAALNSAKIMLAVGTDYDYYNAVWVKNEWSRFLKLMVKDKDKHLIPCYKNLDPYDIPQEFAKLQAQDLGKVGAVQDLMRGIEKLMPGSREENRESVTLQLSGAAEIAPLLKRVDLFLEDGDFESADEYCERILDRNPECAEAYVGKLMAQLRVKNWEDLQNAENPFDDRNDYQKAIRFADEKLRKNLESCIAVINERSDNIRKDGVYTSAQKMMKKDQISSYEEAIRLFQSIHGWKDAEMQILRCRVQIQKLQDMEKQKLLEKKRQAVLRRRKRENRKKKIKRVILILMPILFLVILIAVLVQTAFIPFWKLKTAKAQIASGNYSTAYTILEELDRKDIITESKYERALALTASGDCNSALELLDGLNYKDSEELQNQIMEENLLHFLLGSLEKLSPVFHSLEDHGEILEKEIVSLTPYIEDERYDKELRKYLKEYMIGLNRIDRALKSDYCRSSEAIEGIMKSVKSVKTIQDQYGFIPKKSQAFDVFITDYPLYEESLRKYSIITSDLSRQFTQIRYMPLDSTTIIYKNNTEFSFYLSPCASFTKYTFTPHGPTYVKTIDVPLKARLIRPGQEEKFVFKANKLLDGCIFQWNIDLVE